MAEQRASQPWARGPGERTVIAFMKGVAVSHEDAHALHVQYPRPATDSPRAVHISRNERDGRIGGKAHAQKVGGAVTAVYERSKGDSRSMMRCA